MKTQINKTKELKAKIKQLDAEMNKYYDLYHEERTRTSELREKIERINQERMTKLDRTIGLAEQEIERLIEIIRWQINPSTAERKLSEKDEELLRRGF